MKGNPEDIILLESYIKGMLSIAEKNQLEARLVKDPELAILLKELYYIKLGVRANALHEKMEAIKSFEKEDSTRTNGKSKGFWLILLFFLATVGYLFYFFALKEVSQSETKYKGIYASLFDEQLVLHKTKRSTVQSEEIDSLQRRAYEIYSLQLFDEAVPLLETLWQEKKDTLALFYLGVSKIGIGSTQEGLSILQRTELKKYDQQTSLFFNQ
ncbi:MAG: hypothetical protein WAT79_05580 [Saprospiraceae bacterium]